MYILCIAYRNLIVKIENTGFPPRSFGKRPQTKYHCQTENPSGQALEQELEPAYWPDRELGFLQYLLFVVSFFFQLKRACGIYPSAENHCPTLY